MKLKIKETEIVQLTKYPGEEQTSQVLVVSGLLTPPIAEKLKARDLCYNEEGIPRRFEGNIGLAVKMDGADIIMDTFQARANLVHKLKVSQPRKGGSNDVSLMLTMRMRFPGDVLLSDWVDEINKSTFELRINARQEELNFESDGEEKASNEGEKQEAGATDTQEEPAERYECAYCEEGIPTNDEGTMHIGKVGTVACEHPSAKKAAGTLASARDIAGGTTADLKKSRRDRKPRPTAEEIDAATVGPIETEAVQ